MNSTLSGGEFQRLLVALFLFGNMFFIIFCSYKTQEDIIPFLFEGSKGSIGGPLPAC